MDTQTTLLILLPIVTAILSSYLTFYFAMRSKRTEAMIKFKEEKYSNLVVALQGFIGTTASADIKRKFFEEQYKSWLYSSDDVVKSINELIRFFTEEGGQSHDPEKGRKMIGRIILEMRKDLIGKTELTYIDFRYTDVV